ncbi:MAG: GlsB/YeaQ/YmgE family stress response membrane protein [Actinobacteria bacterium]|nr:GlsB/YeaQ/YmgE family stress response membrane protein [Actinomycetota bacterium]
MLLLGIILFGMLIGAGAQYILNGIHRPIDWTTALISGLVGSFVGGMLLSLIGGDGLALRPSGILGSLVGALIVTAGMGWYQSRKA